MKWDKTIRFTSEAPIIKLEDDEPILTEHVFPSSPFPNARMSGFENQSDSNSEEESNEDEHTQIQRIYEKPRWKGPFANSPCLALMTSFIESAYWGEFAGSAVEFKIPEQETFFAAAIEIKPYFPKTGKVDGFAILTHTATKQMLEVHHREIVIFTPEDALGYLAMNSAEERFNYVIKHRYTGKLEMNRQRTLSKSTYTKKKIALQLGKLERETKYRETLKREHVNG